ncbi:30S ribosomal protein S6 [candidate division WOR-3 bacterium]|nr:30S ribosomal protein S6 [candidate division WOR-3 bacterium]
MNNYELTLIVNPNLSEKDGERLQEELVNLLKNHGAGKFYDIRTERRALAYPVRKHREGIYFFITFLGPADLPEKVRQDLMHREEILRLSFFRLPHPPAGTEPATQPGASAPSEAATPGEVSNE